MKFVKVSVYHDRDSANKVSAIRMWRTITGAGLRESKDFIDTIFAGGYGTRTSVVLNMAQYGEMRFASSADMEISGLNFSDAVRYEKDTVVDFSNFSQ